MKGIFYYLIFVGVVLARIECLICRKRKTKKGGSGYEVLQQCVTESSAQTLLNYAEKSDDEYVKVQLAGLTVFDIIAKEFKYHRSCYQIQKALSTKEMMDENNESQIESTLRERCFNEIRTFVEKEVIEDGDYININTLSEKYGKMQEQLGIEKKGVQNRHLKARLINAFGNRITFSKKSEGLAETILNTEKVNRIGIDDPVELVKEAGRIVRKELLAFPDVYTSWPPHGQELLTKKFEVPFFTETLLLSILTSSNKKTDRSSRIVNSLIFRFTARPCVQCQYW